MIGLLCLSACTLTWAADWPQWRGPNRDGISSETGLLESWPKGGPPLLWKIQGLGEGYAARRGFRRPALHSRPARRRRVCAGLRRQHRQAIVARPHRASRSANRADMGRAARPPSMATASTPWPPTACWCAWILPRASASGVINIVDRFHGRVPHWGISESPLVDGDRVIVTPGGSGAAVVALDKTSGKAAVDVAKRLRLAILRQWLYDAGRLAQSGGFHRRCGHRPGPQQRPLAYGGTSGLPIARPISPRRSCTTARSFSRRTTAPAACC